MNMTPETRLLQLATMVLTDHNQLHPVCSEEYPVYLFSETSDNQDSVLVVGASMAGGYRSHTVIIIDDTEKGNSGYPGASAWKEILKARHRRRGLADPDNIRVVPLTPGALLNTLTESIAIASVAKEEKWSELIIVAPPFHQLRAFVSMVTALLYVGYPTLKVYNRVGSQLPWQKEARHSQGTLTAKRTELILTELERIMKYQQGGTPCPLLPTERVMEYLEWRDRCP